MRAVFSDRGWIFRCMGHATVLVLTLSVLMLSQIQLPVEAAWRVPSLGPSPSGAPLWMGAWTDVPSTEEGYLSRALIPQTVSASAQETLDSRAFEPEDSLRLHLGEMRRQARTVRTKVITYTVQTGDTVYGIAERFGISPETIIWANDKLANNPDLLSIGQKLLILPVSGVYHTVSKGDTLEKIAKKYKVDVEAITGYKYNHVKSNEDLKVGARLIIPGGQKPYVPRRVTATYRTRVPKGATTGSGTFVWPVSGWITQKYWSRHRAIDVGAPKGTPVYAADGGYVVYAGWSDVGYGYMILIDHGNGFRTLYAHLSWYYPESGQSVQKGELIGRVGSTGRSTGPHLHFEIIQNGVKRNPLAFLP